MFRRPFAIVAFVSTLVLGAPVLAADGVLEISQSCAVNSGCFSGDAAGYPIEVTSPGSYKLTSGLTIPAGVAGIVITADDVSLDLNGLSIVGSGNSMVNINCVEALGQDRFTIRYGSIRDCESRGIRTAGNIARVSDLTVSG